jgi:hypothetical protein
MRVDRSLPIIGFALAAVWLAGMAFPAPAIADSDVDRLHEQLKAATARNAADEAENASLKAEIAELMRAQASRATKPPPVKKAAGPTPAPAPTDVGNSLFIRQSAIEASQILVPKGATAPDAKGASFTYGEDYLAKSDSLAVQSFMSWVPPDWVIPPSSPYTIGGVSKFDGAALAPFIYLNGKLADPFKKTEQSAAQFGLNGEAAYSPGSGLDLVVFSGLPFFQTDFRGYGRVYGFDAFVEPYLLDWHLGGDLKDIGNSTPLFWYWRLVPEVEPLRVDTAGLSAFHSNSNYMLLGGTGQFRGVLFHNMPVGPLLCDRISILASEQAYWDADHQRRVDNFHGEIDYALGGKKPALFSTCYADVPAASTDAPPTPNDVQSSIALTYDSGQDRSTFEKARKLAVTLTIEY